MAESPSTKFAQPGFTAVGMRCACTARAKLACGPVYSVGDARTDLNGGLLIITKSLSDISSAGTESFVRLASHHPTPDTVETSLRWPLAEMSVISVL